MTNNAVIQQFLYGYGPWLNMNKTAFVSVYSVCNSCFVFMIAKYDISNGKQKTMQWSRKYRLITWKANDLQQHIMPRTMMMMTVNIANDYGMK